MATTLPKRLVMPRICKASCFSTPVLRNESKGGIQAFAGAVEGNLVSLEFHAAARLVEAHNAVGNTELALAGEAADWAPADDGYNAETDKVVYDGFFHESEFRSAPYFSINIDGIEQLNKKF